MTKSASLKDIKVLARSYHKGVKDSSRSFHGTYGGGVKDLTKKLSSSRKKTSARGKKSRRKNLLGF